MMTDFEIGKTYLIYPVSPYVMKNRWVIGKVLSFGNTHRCSVVNMLIRLQDLSSKDRGNIGKAVVVSVASKSLGEKDKEIKNATDALLTTIDLEDVPDEVDFGVSSACSVGITYNVLAEALYEIMRREE